MWPSNCCHFITHNKLLDVEYKSSIGSSLKSSRLELKTSFDQSANSTGRSTQFIGSHGSSLLPPLRYLPSGLLILQHNNNYCNTFCQYFFCTSSYVMTPFCHILNKHFKVTMFLLLTKSSEWWQEHWHPVIFYKIFTCKNARNLIIMANFGFCIWRQENIARLCIAISFFPVLQ